MKTRRRKKPVATVPTVRYRPIMARGICAGMFTLGDYSGRCVRGVQNWRVEGGRIGPVRRKTPDRALETRS
jgi:hypothetical protein